MEQTAFLSGADAGRAQATLAKLRRHDISALALTGGLAIELHLLRRGMPVGMRPLNDIDFLADAFDDIPITLSEDFIFRHVHPHDPPAKTLLQAVDPDTAARVDVFRACGGEMGRAERGEIAGSAVRIIAVDDLIARNARLCLDLASGTLVPAKHARDFLRLLPLADRESIESIWQEHRKPNHPSSFAQAEELLDDLIASRKHLQIVLEYSQDVHRHCARCESSEAFPLSSADRVLELLGYC